MIRRMMAAAGLLVTMAAVAAAQGGPPPTGGMGGGMQQMQEMLFKGIDLQADQKNKIDAIQKQQMTDIQAIDRQAVGGREKIAEIRNKGTDAIRALLTPDQQKTFDANRDEMRKTMQARPRPPQ